MTTTKKLGSALMAFALALTLALPFLSPTQAYAAEQYDPSTTANLTIHKYEVDNLGGLTHTGDGTQLAGTTVVSPGVTLDDLTGLSGIEFTVTLAQLKSGAAAGSVNVDDYERATGATPSSKTTDTAGEANWANLPHGTYLVEETDTGTTTPNHKFVVSVPSTKADGTGYIYDVHVYPKNQLVDSDVSNLAKKVRENGSGAAFGYVEPAAHGEKDNWQITMNFPKAFATGGSFVITDPVGDRLTIDADPVVTVTADDATTVQTLTAVTDYTYALNAATNTYTISFSAAQLASLAAKGFTAPTPAAGVLPTLTVDFTTTLKANDATGNINEKTEGEALTAFTDGRGAVHNQSLRTAATAGGQALPMLQTGMVTIDKYRTGATATKLPDAQFYLYRTNGSAREYLTYTGGVIGWAAATGTTAPAGAYSVTTNASGSASFVGLSYGEVCFLEEVAAPSGYNLLTAPISVVIGDWGSVGSEVYTIIKGVANSQGFQLPQTGDAGTFLFTFGGLALLATGIAIYAVSRRRKNNEGVK